jgi:hypothetical protein
LRKETAEGSDLIILAGETAIMDRYEPAHAGRSGCGADSGRPGLRPQSKNKCS